MEMDRLREKFLKHTKEGNKVAGDWQVCVVAVQLPGFEVETITNYHSIREKIEYYTNAYDNEFRLKVNPNIRIVGYMLV
jgi:hypothetical protein